MSHSPSDSGLPYRFQDGVLTLTVYVQPGARATEWAGRHAQALRLRLAAPARDGLANRACVSYLADAAGVPRSSVAILQGLRSRIKTVRIQGVAPQRFFALKTAWSS